MLASLLHRRLGRVQKTCSRASCSSSFWCICYLVRPFRPKHSYGSLLPCYGLSSVAPMHREGSDSKLSSALSALWLVCWQSKISSRGQHPLRKKLWDGSRNWVRRGCARCWHSWHCCRQIPLLVRALPNHLLPNWWMLGGMRSLCCSVSQSGHLFEGRRL